MNKAKLPEPARPQRQVGAQTEKSALSVDFATYVPNAAPLSARGVLRLGSVVGNRAAQRLLAKPSGQLQRSTTADPTQTDEGLMEQGAPNRFAQKVYDFIHNPAHAEATVLDLKDDMQIALNEELSALGVPRVDFYFHEAGGNKGWFIFKEWNVQIDADMLLGGTDKKVRDLRQDQIAQLADTAYHESRHAEQYFRVAQLMAMELQRAGVAPAQVRIAMKKQLDRMLTHVIDAAIANPLDANIDPKVVEEIRVWTRSLFGVDKHYREMIPTMKIYAAEPLSEAAQMICDLVPENYLTLPQDQQDHITAQVAAKLPILEARLDRLVEQRKNTLQPELERVSALPPSETFDANNAIMKRHLTKLIELTDEILKQRPVPTGAFDALIAALNIKSASAILQIELIDADHDLPEQLDAEEAGNKVGAALEQLSKQP